MREIVGQTNLQPLLTSGRDKAQQDGRGLMQMILDTYRRRYHTSIRCSLLEADPPGPVIAAFRDVAAAGQDKERFIKEAHTYADRIVPEAKGEASRILAGAEGFRDQTIAEATGQAARFLKVYEEYKKAPEVTRQRLFLEMQERVLSGADKIISTARADRASCHSCRSTSCNEKAGDGRGRSVIMRSFFAFLLSLIVLAAVGFYASAFIVHQNEQALVLRWGEPKR